MSANASCSMLAYLGVYLAPLFKFLGTEAVSQRSQYLSTESIRTILMIFLLSYTLL